MQTILITGGAGFIGSHLADDLLSKGYDVRILDNLTAQVHGGIKRRAYLSRDVDLRIGDIRDPATVRSALKDVDGVFHFAASVGVGQRMQRIKDYTATTTLGTAVLTQELADDPVEALVVASSMSVYGEGLYATSTGSVYETGGRTIEQLKARRWDLETALGEPLTPVPTPETKTPQLASTYALSKFDQERMCLRIGREYGIRTVALRFFNVYGTRQALSNPYTDVLASFATSLLNGKPPKIFEDGEQRRDFVSVHDVVQACHRALTVPGADGGVFNIGSGESVTILQIAGIVGHALGVTDVAPKVTEEARVGDIRHCFADISLAKRVLSYRPKVRMQEGVAEVAEWVAGEHIGAAR